MKQDTPEKPCSGPQTSATSGGACVEYSVVVPFYNEEDAVAPLLEEIRQAMDPLDGGYEVVAVDDRSTDATLRILEDAARQDSRLQILKFEENRGQAAALHTALRSARGSILVTMDGDGQNDPADIPRLLPFLRQADMVVGIRANRQDSWLRRTMSRLANRLRSRLLKDGIADSGCGLKVFRREVVDSFIPIKTLYSFMPALAVAAGFRVSELPVAHRPRFAGSSSYGLRAFLWRPALDLLGVWWFSRRRFSTPGRRLV